jgi:hypothetical protein
MRSGVLKRADNVKSGRGNSLCSSVGEKGKGKPVKAKKK